MIEKRFTDVWCNQRSGVILGLTDNGRDRIFTDVDALEEYLNSLNEVPSPITLTTHISQEDFDKIERMIIKQFDSHSEMYSINKIHALQRQNQRLLQSNNFDEVRLTRAINKKINDVITSIDYGDVSRGTRLFAQNALVELKQELGL